MLRWMRCWLRDVIAKLQRMTKKVPHNLIIFTGSPCRLCTTSGSLLPVLKSNWLKNILTAKFSSFFRWFRDSVCAECAGEARRHFT